MCVCMCVCVCVCACVCVRVRALNIMFRGTSYDYARTRVFNVHLNSHFNVEDMVALMHTLMCAIRAH